MYSKMYICIMFENIASEQTKATMTRLLGIPNDTCLTSANAHRVSSLDIDTYVRKAESHGVSLAFWHLDIAVLDKHFGGAVAAIIALRGIPGIASVEIMPVEGPYTMITRDTIRRIMADHAAALCDHLGLGGKLSRFNWTDHDL